MIIFHKNFEKIKALKANYFLNILKLKRVVTKALNINIIKTYKNLNRKRQNEEIIFKGNKNINGCKLIVAIDVSGSISENDLEKFINILYGLNKKKKDYLFDIIYMFYEYSLTIFCVVSLWCSTYVCSASVSCSTQGAFPRHRNHSEHPHDTGFLARYVLAAAIHPHGERSVQRRRVLPI